MKLSEIAGNLKLALNGDGAAEILTPAPIETAGRGMITFAAGPKYAAALRVTKAACAIVPAELVSEARCATIVSTNPPADFARVLAMFFPPYRPPVGIHPTAWISDGVTIGDEASIGAYVVVGPGTAIGRNAVIHPNVTIYQNVTIGDDFTCHSQVSIREGVTIGNRVTLLNGAVIGAEGYGFVEHEGGLIRVPQAGTVVIEDDAEIGANTTVDRATMGATLIRRGVKLDNLIQIAHNCEVGEFSRMAAQVGLAGSVRVGAWCQFGGQSGFADHVKVGDRTRVMAQAGVHNEVAADAVVGGSPAIEMRIFRRMVAAEPRLPELARRLRALEQKVAGWEEE